MKSNILIYDIETCGINALNADLGYVITFGYIWLDDFLKGKKYKTLSIVDYPRFKKDPHDDRDLLKDILKVLNQADGIVHHYGNKFDAPFLRARLAMTRTGVFPEISQLDTCFLAYKKFKLSSNRLVNVAKALKCKWRKLEKGDGWPTWWFAFSKGDPRYDKKMREYCGFDVMTLAEISERMRPYWPDSFSNRVIPKDERTCTKCGSQHLHLWNQVLYRRKPHKRLRCNDCGFTGNYQKI